MLTAILIAGLLVWLGGEPLLDFYIDNEVRQIELSWSFDV